LVNFAKRVGGVSSGDKPTQGTLVSKFLLGVLIGWVRSNVCKTQTNKKKGMSAVKKVRNKQNVSITHDGLVTISKNEGKGKI